MAMRVMLLLQAVAAACAIPQFTVDLDVAPEERWKEVILYYKNIGAIKALNTEQLVPAPQLPPDVAEEWLEAVRPMVDEEYLREIDGWKKYGGEAKLTTDAMILNQFGYEQNYPTFCSGLLVAMPNGTVVHGRNMDYQLFLEVDRKTWTWEDMTVEVLFTRGGEPFITSVNWPGQLGFHTAMRFNGWTFEQQTRRLGNDMQMNLAAAKQGAVGHSLLARRIMESVPDFETAVQKWWSADLMAPQYMIMAGAKPYEGAVLSLDRGGKHDPQSPPLLRLNATTNEWGPLLQTNDDHFSYPKDYRRPIQKMKMSTAEQADASVDWVFGQMRGFPLNDDLTVFSWVAVPALNYHETVLKRDPPRSDHSASAREKTFNSFVGEGMSPLNKTYLVRRGLVKLAAMR